MKTSILAILLVVALTGCAWVPDGPSFKDSARNPTLETHHPRVASTTENDSTRLPEGASAQPATLLLP